MLMETLFSLATRICRLKHLPQPTVLYLETHLTFVSARFNLLLVLNRLLEPNAPTEDRLLKLAQ
jgi:hypothetical protein